MLYMSFNGQYAGKITILCLNAFGIRHQTKTGTAVILQLMRLSQKNN